MATPLRARSARGYGERVNPTPTTAEAATAPTHILSPLIESLYRMAWIVEARDPYTGGHLWRVSQYSRLLAEDLGLAPDEVARIALGGFLHDLGKIGVPDSILNKPGKLDEAEYAVIKTHPAIGGRLLRGHPLAALALDAVTQHHETPDGRGYPAGLTGHDIPLAARIVGITDAFDAMTSTRPYRPGMWVAKALDVVAGAAGRQFDAEVSERLVRMGHAGLLDHFVGHTDLGIPIASCLSCGPTVVLRRDQRPGDLLHCRHCGGQGRFIGLHDGQVEWEPTGGRGTAEQLEPVVDELLLGELVAVAQTHLAPRYRMALGVAA